jgi:hypothetical protein
MDAKELPGESFTIVILNEVLGSPKGGEFGKCGKMKINS